MRPLLATSFCTPAENVRACLIPEPTDRNSWAQPWHFAEEHDDAALRTEILQRLRGVFEEAGFTADEVDDSPVALSDKLRRGSGCRLIVAAVNAQAPEFIEIARTGRPLSQDRLHQLFAEALPPVYGFSRHRSGPMRLP